MSACQLTKHGAVVRLNSGAPNVTKMLAESVLPKAFTALAMSVWAPSVIPAGTQLWEKGAELSVATIVAPSSTQSIRSGVSDVVAETVSERPL
jgi:hypothetical protein